jgi:pantoate--beta-alanine ligase
MRIQFIADQGDRDAASLREHGVQVVAEEPGVKLDYLEIVDPNTLDPVEDISRGALVAVAAWAGTTRLIDNLLLHGRKQE